MNERIIQNGCCTPSWISMSPLHLQILSSTSSLWTSICSSVPYFIFAFWSFMIFLKIWYRIMAVGRHLECLIPQSSNWNLQKLSHSVPELEGRHHILFLFQERWRFHGWKNYSKWLPDAILNIFVPVTVTDPGKYTPIMNLICSCLPNFIFALWYLMFLGKIR